VQPVRFGLLAEDRRAARLPEKPSSSADQGRLDVGADPEEYGGSGLSLTEATVIMEEVTRSGGNAGCCHGQMYNMNTLLRHGSAQQKQKYLPKIAAGELRLQSMGVTEPARAPTRRRSRPCAVKKGDRYVVNGQKVGPRACSIPS
jgi:alkylation response protein AidB-like acyl-CoA dehydrogenase